MVHGTCLLNLAAGDTVDVRAYQESGASVGLEATAVRNRFSIIRVGL
jgi:hypothetical protein